MSASVIRELLGLAMMFCDALQLGDI